MTSERLDQESNEIVGFLEREAKKTVESLVIDIDYQIAMINELLKRRDYGNYAQEGTDVLKVLYKVRAALLRKQKYFKLEHLGLLSDREEREIFLAYKRGTEVKKIARQYNCSRRTVYRAIERQKKRKVV